MRSPAFRARVKEKRDTSPGESIVVANSVPEEQIAWLKSLE
jgi:hypothetical protein